MTTKKKYDRLLEICRSKNVSEIQFDYFVDNIEDYPGSWGLLYLWSVERKNYELSDYLISIGFDLNTDERVKHEMLISFEFYKRDLFRKIHDDGFILTGEFIDQLKGYYYKVKEYYMDYLDKVILLNRTNKLLKIVEKLKSRKINIAC